jgi:hypothetical protein
MVSFAVRQLSLGPEYVAAPEWGAAAISYNSRRCNPKPTAFLPIRAIANDRHEERHGYDGAGPFSGGTGLWAPLLYSSILFNGKTLY